MESLNQENKQEQKQLSEVSKEMEQNLEKVDAKALASSLDKSVDKFPKSEAANKFFQKNSLPAEYSLFLKEMGKTMSSKDTPPQYFNAVNQYLKDAYGKGIKSIDFSSFVANPENVVVSIGNGVSLGLKNIYADLVNQRVKNIRSSSIKSGVGNDDKELTAMMKNEESSIGELYVVNYLKENKENIQGLNDALNQKYLDQDNGENDIRYLKNFSEEMKNDISLKTTNIGGQYFGTMLLESVMGRNLTKQELEKIGRGGEDLRLKSIEFKGISKDSKNVDYLQAQLKEKYPYALVAKTKFTDGSEGLSVNISLNSIRNRYIKGKSEIYDKKIKGNVALSKVGLDYLQKSKLVTKNSIAKCTDDTLKIPGVRDGYLDINASILKNFGKHTGYVLDYPEENDDGVVYSDVSSLNDVMEYKISGNKNSGQGILFVPQKIGKNSYKIVEYIPQITKPDGKLVSSIEERKMLFS